MFENTYQTFRKLFTNFQIYLKYEHIQSNKGGVVGVPTTIEFIHRMSSSSLEIAFLFFFFLHTTLQVLFSTY